MFRGIVRRRWPVLSGLLMVALAALLVASVALAADPGKEKIALTAAGKAQARAGVLRLADVGTGWKGGFKKPDLSASMPCSNYRPKQSDLVLIGAAESSFSAQALQIDSVAQVLRAPAMVRRDWRRTILAPQVVPCLRQGFAKSIGSSGKLVSFRRVSFPRVATLTRAFRALAQVKTAIGRVPFEIDFLAMGAGRNELTLTLLGPALAKTSLHAEELRLARLLAGRVRQAPA